MLTDLRVVEISSPATMLAGQLLGDLGADVLLVEPPSGAAGRRMEPFAGDIPGIERRLVWQALNRNKRGMTLDPHTADGRAILDTLLAEADVANMRHVERCLEAYVDGLVLLTAGAGGNTGWVNPFAFVRAVRAAYGGPIVLAGGIGDGVALRAAIALGCDPAFMGTMFIATEESSRLVSSLGDDDERLALGSAPV